MLVGLGIVKQVAVNVISYPNRTMSHQYLYPIRIEFLARAARRVFKHVEVGDLSERAVVKLPRNAST